MSEWKDKWTRGWMMNEWSDNRWMNRWMTSCPESQQMGANIFMMIIDIDVTSH